MTLKSQNAAPTSFPHCSPPGLTRPLQKGLNALSGKWCPYKPRLIDANRERIDGVCYYKVPERHPAVVALAGRVLGMADFAEPPVRMCTAMRLF